MYEYVIIIQHYALSDLGLSALFAYMSHKKDGMLIRSKANYNVGFTIMLVLPCSAHVLVVIFSGKICKHIMYFVMYCL